MSMTAGDIVIVDWHDALPKEANKMRADAGKWVLQSIVAHCPSCHRNVEAADTGYQFQDYRGSIGRDTAAHRFVDRDRRRLKPAASKLVRS
jgi:hypothetical protein